MEAGSPLYHMRLFITGASPNSVRAVTNMKNICETYLGSNYTLEIIDVYQQPLLAQHDQVVALPMLIKTNPLPLKRLIGDMSDTAKVLKGLDFDAQL